MKKIFIGIILVILFCSCSAVALPYFPEMYFPTLETHTDDVTFNPIVYGDERQVIHNIVIFNMTDGGIFNLSDYDLKNFTIR